MKSYQDYQKLAKQVSEQAASGKVDPALKRDKAAAFNEYRKEQRSAAARGLRIEEGKPAKWRDSEGRAAIESGPSKRSLQEEYVRKLSEKPMPKSDENPRGLSPRQLAAERLGV